MSRRKPADTTTLNRKSRIINELEWMKKQVIDLKSFNEFLDQKEVGSGLMVIKE